jgi:hypothetical protein
MEPKMSNDHEKFVRQKARADAAEGKNDPPRWGVFNTTKTIESRRIDQQVYREERAKAQKDK